MPLDSSQSVGFNALFTIISVPAWLPYKHYPVAAYVGALAIFLKEGKQAEISYREEI